ncbi:MAG: zf-HC2 domain-containing protein [Candidatus Bipolaricaulota bacterium]
MIDCNEAQELLPWYATGRLPTRDAEDVAAHLLSCSACRNELADVVWLRQAIGAAERDNPPVRGQVWRRIMTSAGLRPIADIDIGSLLVGLRLGVSASRARPPVRASLHVLGRRVRIANPSRRKPNSDPGEEP